MDVAETANLIKGSVLKFVPAKYIYLFGSYAYGNPAVNILNNAARKRNEVII